MRYRAWHFAALILCVSADRREQEKYKGRLSNEENEKVQDNCGKNILADYAKKVIGGRAVEISEAPSAVALSYYNGYQVDPNYEDMIQCSGTLISPRHVLSAAHCLGVKSTHCANGGGSYPGPASYERDIMTDWAVHLNISRLYTPHQTERDRAGHMKVKVKRVFHPLGMDLGNCGIEDYGDIAVFELEEDIPQSPDLSYACLSANTVEDSTFVHLFGYGKDTADPAVDIPAKTGPYLGGVLKTYYTKMRVCQPTKLPLAKDAICARAEDLRMACTGDSGSGYLHNRKDGRTEVVAVLTGGPSCIKATQLLNEKNEKYLTEDQAVDVAYHLPWICTTTGICPPNASSLKNVKDLSTKRTGYKTISNMIMEPMGEIERPQEWK